MEERDPPLFHAHAGERAHAPSPIGWRRERKTGSQEGSPAKIGEQMAAIFGVGGDGDPKNPGLGNGVTLEVKTEEERWRGKEEESIINKAKKNWGGVRDTPLIGVQGLVLHPDFLLMGGSQLGSSFPTLQEAGERREKKRERESSNQRAKPHKWDSPRRRQR